MKYEWDEAKNRTDSSFFSNAMNSCTVLTGSFDLDEIASYRQSWGVFRDRRPDLYYPVLSLDGRG